MERRRPYGQRKIKRWMEDTWTEDRKRSLSTTQSGCRLVGHTSLSGRLEPKWTTRCHVSRFHWLRRKLDYIIVCVQYYGASGTLSGSIVINIPYINQIMYACVDLASHHSKFSLYIKFWIITSTNSPIFSNLFTLLLRSRTFTQVISKFNIFTTQ